MKSAFKTASVSIETKLRDPKRYIIQTMQPQKKLATPIMLKAPLNRIIQKASGGNLQLSRMLMPVKHRREMSVQRNNFRLNDNSKLRMAL
jgi:hypothetical protein